MHPKSFVTALFAISAIAAPANYRRYEGDNDYTQEDPNDIVTFVLFAYKPDDTKGTFGAVHANDDSEFNIHEDTSTYCTPGVDCSIEDDQTVFALNVKTQKLRLDSPTQSQLVYVDADGDPVQYLHPFHNITKRAISGNWTLKPPSNDSNSTHFMYNQRGFYSHGGTLHTDSGLPSLDEEDDDFLVVLVALDAPETPPPCASGEHEDDADEDDDDDEDDDEDDDDDDDDEDDDEDDDDDDKDDDE